MTDNKTDSQSIKPVTPAHALVLAAIELMEKEGHEPESPLWRFKNDLISAEKSFEIELYGIHGTVHASHGEGQALGAKAPGIIQRSIDNAV